MDARDDAYPATWRGADPAGYDEAREATQRVHPARREPAEALTTAHHALVVLVDGKPRLVSVCGEPLGFVVVDIAGVRCTACKASEAAGGRF